MIRPRIKYIVIDCADPERLAAFWGQLLGVQIAGRFGEGRYVFLEANEPGAPRLAFQRVPERKTVKNRVHVDLHLPANALDQVTSWVRSHGGSRIADVEEGGIRWRVVADPEGNEFDLVPDES